MKKICPWFLAPFLLFPASAMALDPTLPEMVISASKGESLAAESTMSIGVVTGEELRERQINDPAQAISTLPGVTVTRQGGMGQTSTISIRGASPRYTQFRFDDFPLRDIAGTQNDLSFYSGNLYMEQNSLSRMEVLRGSRGSLYGSSASGGIVSMFTGNKWGTGFHGAVRGEAGSFGSRSVGGNVSYGNEKYYFNFNPLHLATDGDRGFWYDQTGFNAGAGVKFTDATRLEFTSLGIMNDGAMPELQPSFNGAEILPQKHGDRDYHRTGNMAMAGLTLTHDFSPIWESRLKAALSRTSRVYYYGSNSIGQGLQGEEYYGEWLNTVRPLDNLTLIAGLDVQHDALRSTGNDDPDANIRKSNNSWAAFGKGELALLDRSLILNLGGRLSMPSDYSAHATWDAGLAYIFKEWGTRVYATVATGFRTPSLYERYAYVGKTPWSAAYVAGNKNLKTETSITYEAGVEQKLFDERLTLGAAVFRTDYDNMIDYVTIDPITWTGQYRNASKGKSTGFELTASARPCDLIGLNLAYTYTDTRSRNSGQPWKRVMGNPLNQASATVTVYPLDSVTLAATVLYQDSRTITLSNRDYTASYTVRQPAFTTVDLAATWNMNENLSFFARAENLFDKKYTQSGFFMPGFSTFFGMEVKF